MSAMSRRCCGSAFQSVGPAMLKDLLPAMVDRVHGTPSRLCSWERRPLDGTCGTISPCKYAGAALCIALYTVKNGARNNNMIRTFGNVNG